MVYRIINATLTVVSETCNDHNFITADIALSCSHVVDPLLKYLPEPELIHDVDFGFSVWGLAILNDELFIVTFIHRDVYVFDLKTLNRFAILEFG